MSQPTFNIDFTEFDNSLRQYMNVTTRALPDVLNRKGFYVARGACRETPRVQKQTIINELGQTARRTVGGVRKWVTIMLTKASERRMSLAEAIVRRNIYRKGYPQPYSRPGMRSLIEDLEARLIGSRMKSLAYLASGWLPVMRQLFAAAYEKDGTPRVAGVKQWGPDQGRAVPAKPGWRVSVIMENSAAGKTEEGGEALLKYGTPPLQRALDTEAAGMMNEVSKRMAKEGRALGIRIMG